MNWRQEFSSYQPGASQSMWNYVGALVHMWNKIYKAACPIKQVIILLGFSSIFWTKNAIIYSLIFVM